MADITHQWGEDLSLSPTGDLALVSNSVMGRQRILRRLLTNPGDYIWQLDYGAGLARFVGQPVSPRQICAIIRSQIFKESVVAHLPEPVIDVEVPPGEVGGIVYVHIRYVDLDSSQTQTLSFSVMA